MDGGILLLIHWGVKERFSFFSRDLEATKVVLR